MTAPISTHRAYSLGRPLAATGAVLVALCGVVLSGCAPAQSSEPLASAHTDVAAVPEVTDPMVATKSEATHRLRETIVAGGVTSPLPDDTLQALGDGICHQLAAGTERSTIVENLRSVTNNGATSRPGQLQDVPGTDATAAASTDAVAPTATSTDDADHMAKVIVDAAQATYC